MGPSPYRGLSKIQGGINLSSSSCSYEATINNLAEEVNTITSQQCCYAVSQIYEVFESYLISILTEYLLHNQGRLVEVKLKVQRIILIKETIRQIVKDAQDTNNKGLLRMVRKLSKHFKQYERHNIFSVDIWLGRVLHANDQVRVGYNKEKEQLKGKPPTEENIKARDQMGTK